MDDDEPKKKRESISQIFDKLVYKWLVEEVIQEIGYLLYLC